MLRSVAVVALLVAAAAPAALPAAAQPADSLSLVATVPNPVAEDDAGESVLLHAPDGTDLGAYTLTDGESRVDLPNRTVSGPVVLTAAPDRVRNRTDHPVLDVALPALSNAGERLRLRRGNRTVSTLRYADAPEGERYRNGTWRPVGATDYPVVRGGPGTARAFVLPDAPGPPLAPIRNATERVLLAGYTFTSVRAARALANASERGAEVRVLLEGSPVGGMSRREARRLDALVAAGVEVRVVAGPHARYAFHHAKYAVADDRAVVLTENWKPAGTGGADSRGWGAVVSEPSVVSGLVRTFSGDFTWRAAVPWEEYRTRQTFVASNATTGRYPSAFATERVSFESARLLVAPDNAESALLADLRTTNESLRVIQMSVGGPEQAFVRETVAAARRGVSVRVLLSGAWYVREENRAVVERLNSVAEREGLEMSARLAVPSGYSKIHAKGVVADETVFLGSLNWNDHSARENREVVLALTGAAADYYRRVFDADWRASAPGPTVPGGVVAALVVAALASLLAAREMGFE